MRRRIFKVGYQLWKKKGFDILLTHSPAYGLNDEEHIAHRGFECFIELLEKYKPKYFIHGHVHRNYGQNIPQICTYQDTIVVNAYEYCKLDYVVND